MAEYERVYTNHAPLALQSGSFVACCALSCLMDCRILCQVRPYNLYDRNASSDLCISEACMAGVFASSRLSSFGASQLAIALAFSSLLFNLTSITQASSNGSACACSCATRELSHQIASGQIRDPPTFPCRPN